MYRYTCCCIIPQGWNSAGIGTNRPYFKAFWILPRTYCYNKTTLYFRKVVIVFCIYFCNGFSRVGEKHAVGRSESICKSLCSDQNLNPEWGIDGISPWGGHQRGCTLRHQRGAKSAAGPWELPFTYKLHGEVLFSDRPVWSFTQRFLLHIYKQYYSELDCHDWYQTHAYKIAWRSLFVPRYC